MSGVLLANQSFNLKVINWITPTKYCRVGIKEAYKYLINLPKRYANIEITFNIEFFSSHLHLPFSKKYSL